MSLNVSIDDVPFAILEMVKARILAQRQKQQQAKPTAPKGPRPQFRRFGASSKAYRMPRPAALPDDDVTSLGHLWWFMDSEPVTNFGVNARGIYADASIYQVGLKRTSRLYCGDGSKYVEIIHGQQQQQILPAYTGFPYIPDAPVKVPASINFPDNNIFLRDGSDESRLFILPAGNDTFVAIFMAWNVSVSVNAMVPITGSTVVGGNPAFRARCGFPDNDGGTLLPGLPLTWEHVITNPTVSSQTSLVSRAFICSNTNIREIEIPASFQPLIDIQYSQTTIANKRISTTLVNNFSNRYCVAFASVPEINNYLENFSDGLMIVLDSEYDPETFYANLTGRDYDPESYPWVNDSKELWQAKIGSIVKQKPADLRYLISDLSKGAYAEPYNTWTASHAFNDNLPFAYGRWTDLNTTPVTESIPTGYRWPPDKFTSEPERDFRMAPGRPTVDEASYESLHVVWDWDDPDYCRQVCLALGFSTADLEP